MFSRTRKQILTDMKGNYFYLNYGQFSPYKTMFKGQK